MAPNDRPYKLKGRLVNVDFEEGSNRMPHFALIDFCDEDSRVHSLSGTGEMAQALLQSYRLHKDATLLLHVEGTKIRSVDIVHPKKSK